MIFIDPENSAIYPSSTTGILRKDSKVDLGRLDEKSLSSKNSLKKTLPKPQSKEIDDPDSDALNDIFSDSTLPLRKSSPVKKNTRIADQTVSDVTKNSEEVGLNSLGKDKKNQRKSKDSFFDSFFKNLSSPKGSPEKSSATSSLDKKVKENVIGKSYLIIFFCTLYLYYFLAFTFTLLLGIFVHENTIFLLYYMCRC